MSLFWKVLGLVFFAELGDKTQFLMIAMASQYRLGDIVLGVSLAIVLLNALAVAAGVLLGGVLSGAVIGIVAGLAFLWFAYASVGQTEDAGELRDVSSAGKRMAALQVFGTFFLAELGDKTQLTALTFTADSGGNGWSLAELSVILCASSLALLSADVLGLLIGYFLGKTMPQSTFAWLSFLIFFAFGIVKLLGGLEVAFAPTGRGRGIAIAGTFLVGSFLVWLTLSKLIKIRKHRDVQDGTTKNAENRKSLSVFGYE